MRGKETYLRQSVTAVLIGLVATLAVGWRQTSRPKSALQPDKPLIEVRTVSSQTFDILFAPEKHEEPTESTLANPFSMRVCFAANTRYFLKDLLTGGGSDEPVFTSKAQRIN